MHIQPSRALLSTQPRTADEPSADDVADLEAALDASNTTGKAPSVLQSLPDGYTPGLALSVLQTSSAGGKFIRLTDFRDLALAARAGHHKDAGVILTALKDFKRCNSFSVDTRGTRVAMQGMVRALTPLENKDYGSPSAMDMVNANLFVLDAFMDTKTGLYYAAKTEYVEIHMKQLLDAVKEAKLKLPAGFNEEAKDSQAEEEVSDETQGDDDDSESTALAICVLHTTRDAMAALIKRGIHPERQMTKRKARKYLKQLRIDDGPAPSTVHVGVEICLELGASAKLTRNMLLSPYRRARYKTDEETVLLADNKEKAEKEAVKAAEEQAKAAEMAAAAAAAAEAEAEAEAAAAKEAEDQESSTDDEEAVGDTAESSEAEGDNSDSGEDTDAKKE